MSRYTVGFTIVLALVVLGIVANQCDAIPSRSWTYRELIEESDLVCIAEVISTKKLENYELFPEFLDKFASELKIRAVFKGDQGKETLTFVHYRYRPDVNARLINGPDFTGLPISEELGRERREGGLPTSYLLFCKRRKDERRYGPVTGDYFPSQSISVLEIRTAEE